MEISTNEYKHCVLVKVNGRIDSTATPYVEETLNKLISQGSHKIIIDLADVDYISSAGFRLLLVTHKKLAKEKGKLALSSVPERVREAFEIAGLEAIFLIFLDAETAIANF